MEFRNLGKSGLKVSSIGFGCWGISGDLGQVNSKEMINLIKEAYNLGVNFFDTSPAYGYESGGIKKIGISEKILGKALKGIRDRVIVATKFGIVYGKDVFNSSRKSIMMEVDESLRRLHTNYIDLYQAHWPDPKTPLKETFYTLNELKEAGKVRFIGICNYSINQIEEAIKYCEIISSQNLYNMIQRNTSSIWGNKILNPTENEILPYCNKKGLAFIPYSPFCQGLLTGEYIKAKDYNFEDFRKSNDELKGEKLLKNLELIKELLKISSNLGKPLSEMVLNWLRKDKRITSIIAGPTKLSQLRSNIESTTWELDDEIYNKINKFLDKN